MSEYTVSPDCLRVHSKDRVFRLAGVTISTEQLLRTDEEATLRGMGVIKPVFISDGATEQEVGLAKEAWLDAVRPLSEVAQAKGLKPSTGRVYVSKHGVPTIRVGKVCWVNRHLSWTKS